MGDRRGCAPASHRIFDSSLGNAHDRARVHGCTHGPGIHSARLRRLVMRATTVTERSTPLISPSFVTSGHNHSASPTMLERDWWLVCHTRRSWSDGSLRRSTRSNLSIRLRGRCVPALQHCLPLQLHCSPAWASCWLSDTAILIRCDTPVVVRNLGADSVVALKGSRTASPSSENGWAATLN